MEGGMMRLVRYI